jgi:hypothetical protein
MKAVEEIQEHFGMAINVAVLRSLIEELIGDSREVEDVLPVVQYAYERLGSFADIGSARLSLGLFPIKIAPLLAKDDAMGRLVKTLLLGALTRVVVETMNERA